jgi:hypothetical protein
MNRRTTQVIYPAGLIEKTEAVDEVRATSAGYFFKLLNERAIQCARGSQFKYEIYLFGHSMGAIVLNKAFTEYRADWIESGAIKEIAYMAAACSVADGLNALKPLLLAYNTNGSPLLFHNLTLNRVAEIAEPTAFGVAPSGSLLEYIDQHLESPDSAVDRTLGSEVNVLPAIHVFDGIQQYCRFKGFDRFPHTLPTKHSDFNKVPFWLPEFWDPSTKTAHGNSYPSDWLEHYQPARALPLHLRPAKR